jgi:hypothetical protein
MAEVLHVYKEVEIVKTGLLEGTLKEPPVVTISCDEKPGIQALATTTPDLPPAPNRFASLLRDSEYIRPGTVSLPAGLDLHTGRVTEIVGDRHASADFIALLGKLDESLSTANPHSQPARQPLGAHLERNARLAESSPADTAQWLNIVETMIGRMARGMLRGIRVAGKQELVDRIHLYFDLTNADPVIFRWKYKMDETIIV